MEEKDQEQRLADFEGLIDRLILDGDLPERLTPEQKIDLLARLLEQWRFERFKLENKLPMEQMLNMEWLIHDDRVFVRQSEVLSDHGKGTKPLQLQRRLLAHLLIDHGQTRSILALIDGFIARIHKELGPVDFKRTDTGVIRCYTNTRFAANKLRDAGLLKFTQREAYKIWLLTLPGFLVAAKALQEPLPPINAAVKFNIFGLDLFIHECRSTVKSYPDFVMTLSSICAPEQDIFTTFEPVLAKCHAHLQGYWKTLDRFDLKADEIATLSNDLIRKIDQTEGYGKFIEEFSASIQLDRLIKEVQRPN